MSRPEKTIAVVSVVSSKGGDVVEEDEVLVGIGGAEVLSSPHATKLNAPIPSAQPKISGVKNFEFILIPFLCSLLMKINKMWKKSTTNLKKSV
jgi:hypothetical protein